MNQSSQSEQSDSTNQADELEKQIIEMLGLHETLNGQLIPNAEDYLADWTFTVEEILALFNQAQQQLLRELMEQLPEKLQDESDETGELIKQSFNAAIDQVTALLTKKLQAYGGDNE